MEQEVHKKTNIVGNGPPPMNTETVVILQPLGIITALKCQDFNIEALAHDPCFRNYTFKFGKLAPQNLYNLGRY